MTEPKITPDSEYAEMIKRYSVDSLYRALARSEENNFENRIKIIKDEIKLREDAGEVLKEHEDVGYAQRYMNKAENAKSRGINFELSFSEYRRIVDRKLCYYTGIKLTNHNPKLPTHVTIERLDASKGYTKDNCVGCSLLANSIKNAVLEDPRADMLLTVKQFKRMAEKL